MIGVDSNRREMLSKDLKEFRNSTMNLNLEYSESLFVNQDSSQGNEAVSASDKASALENFFNLVDSLLGFLIHLDNVEIFKSLIRNIHLKSKYLFTSGNHIALSTKLPKIYVNK